MESNRQKHILFKTFYICAELDCGEKPGDKKAKHKKHHKRGHCLIWQ